MLGAVGEGILAERGVLAEQGGGQATVIRRVVAASYTIVNVDVTVVTEAPRLAPHVDAMRERIAGVLALPASAVSVKGKTNEQLDDVGRGKGLVVFAIASLGGA